MWLKTRVVESTQQARWLPLGRQWRRLESSESRPKISRRDWGSNRCQRDCLVRRSTAAVRCQPDIQAPGSTLAMPPIPQQDKTMGRDRTGSTTPDLFPTVGERSSPPINPPPPLPPNAAVRYILPRDLPNAIKRLTDAELDQLVAVASAEQQRRCRKPPALEESPRKRQVEEAPLPLTSGKLNAVRAAFKAGITPSRIARQFGISQSDVGKALVGVTPNRK